MPQHQALTELQEAASAEKPSRLARVVCGLSVIAVCAKVFGFAEKIVIAHYFGTSETADVYFAIMAVVLSIVFLVRELIYPTLLPVFNQTREESPAIAGRLFGKVFLFVAVSLTLTALVGVIFSQVIIRIIVPGFSASQQMTMAHLLRLLAPVIVFPGLMAVTYTILNARRRFLISAMGEIVFKGLILAGLIILLPIIGLDALAVVLGIGGLACLIFHLCYLPERSFILQFGSGTGEPFKKMLLLIGPLAAGVVFSHISGLVDNLLASTLPSGRLSYLNYAKKIVDAVLLIGPVAVVTVVYSQVSHLAAQGRQEELTRLIGRIARLLLYVSLPATCLLIALREPFLRCLFQHGQFDIHSTIGTSNVLLIYASGLVTFSLEALLVYSFFALSDTKTPVIYGIVCVFLDIILAFALLPYFQEVGIAAALVISKTIKVFILANRLGRRLRGLWNIGIFWLLAKLLIATVIMAIALKAVASIYISDSLLGIAVYDLLLPGAAGISAYFLVSFILKIDECRQILSLVYSKAKSARFFNAGS